MSTTSPEGKARGQPPKEPNVLNVVLGNLLIKPWYPSFYPEDLVGKVVNRLYVCQSCFRYSKELMPYLAHMKVCTLNDSEPPGTMIYSTSEHALYEIDGEEHKLYCQNLSLFAKLFLDTKSVFYDVTTFRYYLLVLNDRTAPQKQVVGFFSKEKMSWDNNNVACILVFPPWQRKGLGQILMGASYELSKREGRLGGPEKPLSTLGRRAYLAYWSAAIYRCLAAHPFADISIRYVVQQTWIQAEDVIAALKEMNVVGLENSADGGGIILDSGKLKAWALACDASLTSPVDVSAFRGITEDRSLADAEDS